MRTRRMTTLQRLEEQHSVPDSQQSLPPPSTTPTSAFSRLTSDELDLICEHLSTPNDASDLLSLCLTSKSLLPVARRALYRRPLEFVGEEHSPTWKRSLRLLRTLRQETSLANHVRYLNDLVHFVGHLPYQFVNRKTFEVRGLRISDWMVEGKSPAWSLMHAFIKACPRVKTLDITYGNEDQFEKLKEAIEQLDGTDGRLEGIQIKHDSVVSLSTFRNFLATTPTCRSLTNIDINVSGDYTSTPIPTPTSSESEPEHLLHLTKLHVCAHSRTVPLSHQFALIPFYPPTLQSLELCASSCDAPFDLVNVARVVGPTIKKLSIKISNDTIQVGMLRGIGYNQYTSWPAGFFEEFKKIEKLEIQGPWCFSFTKLEEVKTRLGNVLKEFNVASSMWDLEEDELDTGSSSDVVKKWKGKPKKGKLTRLLENKVEQEPLISRLEKLFSNGWEKLERIHIGIIGEDMYGVQELNKILANRGILMRFRTWEFEGRGTGVGYILADVWALGEKVDCDREEDWVDELVW